MNIGFGLNVAALFRPTNAPTQAQVNAQVACGSGSDFARDRVSRTKGRERSMNQMLGKVSQRKVAIAAAKVGAKKGA